MSHTLDGIDRRLPTAFRKAAALLEAGQCGGQYTVALSVVDPTGAVERCFHSIRDFGDFLDTKDEKILALLFAAHLADDGGQWPLP